MTIRIASVASVCCLLVGSTVDAESQRSVPIRQQGTSVGHPHTHHSSNRRQLRQNIAQRGRPDHHHDSHHHQGHHHRHHYHGRHFVVRPGSGLFVIGVPYANTYSYYWNSYYADPRIIGFPPVVVPAGNLFGLQAVRQFIGGGAQMRQQPNRALNGRQARRGAKRPIRIANAAARKRTVRFLQQGDTHFAGQRYRRAHSCYKRASSAAPNLGEAFFRQGHAQLAMGQYPRAARSYKRGLELQSSWPRSNFRWEKLYGKNQKEKQAHLDALNNAANENPLDGDLQFLVGVYLHFDDQPQQGLVYFDRAKQLSDSAEHLAGFLPEPSS